MSRYPLKWLSDMQVAKETTNTIHSAVHCARTQPSEILILHIFFFSPTFCEIHSLCLQVHQHVLI